MENRNQEITDYFKQYEDEKRKRLECIRNLIHEEIPEISEKMWTGVPCFYLEKQYIVIRVFKDHINIFANKIGIYKSVLSGYRITPKEALQIFDNQEIPLEILRKIFSDSFTE
jgi:uncharacterized protein YdhG (YjbR/CyaY superfamily)